MNPIDMIFKNLHFQTSGYNSNPIENFEVPLFAAGHKLGKFVQKDFELEKKLPNKTPFKKHPKYFANNSILLSDTDDDSTETIHDEDIIHKKFKRYKNKFSTAVKLPFGLDECDDIFLNNIISKKQTLRKDFTKIKENKPKTENTKKIVKSKTDLNMKNPIETSDNNSMLLSVNLITNLMKISRLFDELSVVINAGVTPVDGSQDYELRETRAKGFATRFYRQYYYELERQIDNLRTYIPRITVVRFRNLAVQNITKSCQIIIKALRQYCIHYPTTIISSAFEKKNNIHLKFDNMLKKVSDLFLIIKNISNELLDVKDNMDIIKDLEIKYKSVVPLFYDKVMKAPNSTIQQHHKQLISSATTKSKPVKKEKKLLDEPLIRKQPIEMRLSMYSAGPNRKNKRMNVQSRYRTAGIVKSSVVEPQNPVTPPQKKSSKHSNDDGSSINLMVKQNEDEIETMVQKEAENWQQLSNGMPTSSDITIKSKVDAIIQNWTEVSKDKPKLDKELILTQMVNLIEECQWVHIQHEQQHVVEEEVDEEETEDEEVEEEDKAEEEETEEDEAEEECFDIIPEPLSLKPKQKTFIHTAKENDKTKVFESGQKNAKLFIIKHKSLFESESCGTESQLNMVTSVPIEKEIDVMPAIKTVSPIRHDFNKKRDKSIIYILTYRKKLKNFNGLYNTNSRIPPWLATNKIADKILQNQLLSVCSEINLNEIAAKIYKAEFL